MEEISNHYQSITTDVNFPSDEYNLFPISEQVRECGDGDSEAESREHLEAAENCSHTYKVIKDSLKDITGDSLHLMKLRDRQISKIPVRQVKSNKYLSKTVDCSNSSPVERSCLINHKNVNGSPVTHVEEREISEYNNNSSIFDDSTLRQPKEENAQISLNPISDPVGRRLNEQSQENADILKIRSKRHDEGEVAQGSQFPSFILRMPPVDLAVPILEAPEEFRCLGEELRSEQVDIVEPEERHTGPSYRDSDNACTAETGDTIRRALGEDEGDQGNESARPIQTVATRKSSSLCDQNASHKTTKDDLLCRKNMNIFKKHVDVTVPTDENYSLPRQMDGSSTIKGAHSCIIEGVHINNESSSIVGCVECAGESDAVNVPGLPPPETSCKECVELCADQPQSETATTTGPSIEIGVAKCAQASGCSRVSTAKVSVALNSGQQFHICGESTRRRNTTALDIVNTSLPSKKNLSLTNLIESTAEQFKTKIDCVNSPAFKHLSWKFRNGRLVFEENNYQEKQDINTHDKKEADFRKSAEVCMNSENESGGQSDHSQDSDEINKVLYSKNINKRIDESRSRLKYLEQKLKEAGITDQACFNEIANNKHVDSDPHKFNNINTIEKVVGTSSTISIKKVDYDANQNILKNQHYVSATGDKSLDSDENNEIIPEGTDTVDFVNADFCEFDVRHVDEFLGFTGHWEVYDEFDDDSACEDEHHLIFKATVKKDDQNMGIDGERAKHNPDRDNLKSLLKRPGKTKDKTSNRVVFNENKNEFFDADYIILIREECDYDDEDDDSVCTCNQHEMVRLTCCEPNCNCSIYDGFEQTPQSPKFAPPLEFVDAVTLSPPEGYKDLELEEQQLLALQQIARRGQRMAVCRECSVVHDDPEDDGDGSMSDNETCVATNCNHEEPEEKEKTDQSQQTTPTTPPNDSDSPNSQQYILETITMTTVTEQRILRDVDEEGKTVPNVAPAPSGSPINGILKGGKLWKQQSVETNPSKPLEPPQGRIEVTELNVPSDEESSSRRSVRFIESEQNKRDNCDGAPKNLTDESIKMENSSEQPKQNDNCNSSVSPESTEMMLTFKLGNHVLISNNSLKPNSAVRQLFPCTKQLNSKTEDESIHQYLVTAESLRAFEEAKRSKLPQIIQSGESDESIKRAIERNTLRRSLIRYEPRAKKSVQKTDNSLVERIKQLTCDVDDIPHPEEIALRASPPGEEARNSPEVTQSSCKNSDKSFSPSSSSTASSNSSSVSSTYKKITDLFGKRERPVDIQNNTPHEAKFTVSLPDLGNGGSYIQEVTDGTHSVVSKSTSTNDHRKQFLSTLAPLTACVSGMGNTGDYYYQINNHVAERSSVASSVGTEYSLEDIDEGLKNLDEDSKKIAPDVLAGTPSASESGDELAMFVQQDAGRIERIKRKYQQEQLSKEDEDDEHDDYGFNRRPSVRGIKPRFGSSTEILQQIQNQLQLPAPTARVAWPYYSESGLTGVDNSKTRNINQNMPNYQYSNVPEDVKTKSIPSQYRPTSLQDENIYQNCANQRCTRDVYRVNGNQSYSFMKVGSTCSEYYQSLPRTRSGRPQSPPPLELSKNYHQTLVYIPYNHIEGYQQIPYYQSSDYGRVSNHNQINKRYIEPVYQQRIHSSHIDEHHYVSNTLPPMSLKPVVRIPLPQSHLMTSRCESPVSGQFSTARSTQTPLATTSICNNFPGNSRYRPVVGPVWPNDPNYVSKINRHSFPSAVSRFPPADSISLTDSDSQHSGQIPNGFRQSVETSFHKDSLPNSPTKSRFLERGVPEGAAASVPSLDTTTNSQSSSSTMTSPTSPQNPPHSNPKPIFYAMNV